MRILKVVQAYYPFQERGGPVVKVRALARGLVRRGHQVTVLTADLGLAGYGGLAVNPEPCKWGWRLSEDGIEAFYLPTLARYRALTLNPRVLGFCRAGLAGFDVVHFYGLYDFFGPAVSYSCRRRRIPYVVEPMGMYRPIDRNFRLKALWHCSMGRAFCQKAAQIVATSEMEREGLLQDGILPGKLVVRYNGVDAEFYGSSLPSGDFRKKWHISAEEPLIVFLSRLIPRKGADLLIQAFADACRELGRLVIAGPEGEPGYRSYLARCAKEYCVEARVIFTGPLYEEEKRAALADANLFVLPSRYENFANVAAEAIACGVPVIISDACGISSLVAGRAGLVIPPEREALAGALRTLMEDKALYARLKEGCRRVASQLGWDHLTEQMEGYYVEAMATNRDQVMRPLQ
jgi:glycosyltransferase involved in cell wall biosynthesis